MTGTPNSSDDPSPRIDPSVRKLLLGIWHTFPDVALRMKRVARQRGAVWFATCAMMEEFSQATTDAMRVRDEASVRAHLHYVEAVLRTADAITLEYIDVYYVECLMWDLDEPAKKWAWARMPSSLKALYINFWGKLGVTTP